MKLLYLFNTRTVVVLVVSQLSVFLALHYQIRFNLDLLLFGLAIAFPLAFSIQSAFKRRDRALEYFSLYKGGTVALLNSFTISEELPAERKMEIRGIIENMTMQLIHQLERRLGSYVPMQKNIDHINAFIERNREFLSNRNILRMIRYIRDIAESSAYLISLVRHRTMAGLRFYSVVFIMLFPIVQAPIILYRLEQTVPYWAVYVLMAFSSLILVTLSNFQKLIEYPFDPKGMDNIHIHDFRLQLEQK